MELSEWKYTVAGKHNVTNLVIMIPLFLSFSIDFYRSLISCAIMDIIITQLKAKKEKELIVYRNTSYETID